MQNKIMPNIKLISNTNSSHLLEIKSLSDSMSGRFIIASPFLASNFTDLLSEFSYANIESIDLITTFKPCDPEQYTKPKTLLEYFEFFKNKYPSIKTKLHIDNHLHGKLYIFVQHEFRRLILSSANFTRNGLCNNHEWGILIEDDSIIDNIVEELFDSIEYQDVNYHQIKRAVQFSEAEQRYNKDLIPKKLEISSDILEKVYSVENQSNTEPKYFLKPIGHSESPILLEDQHDFSDLHQYLHFSKKKPKGVRKGDIVITTAIGAGSLLSYFKVTGGLHQATQEEIREKPWKERWPWYMEGRNLSPKFGGEWWIHNIKRQDALNDFLEDYPGIPVTYAGGFNLATINRGNDKVRITEEFGKYLISKIKNCITKEST